MASDGREATEGVAGPHLSAPATPKLRELGLASAVLLLALIVFFPEASVRGRVIASNSFRESDPAYARAAKPLPQFDFVDASPEVANHPFTIFQARSFRRLQAPLWNPYNGCGAPLLADGQSSPFYPLKLITYIPRDPLRLYSLYLLVNLLIAGVSTYWYCRIMGLRPLAAYFSSISYMLCGALVVRLEFYDFPPAALLPVVLIALEMLARKPSSLSIVGTGLVGALQVSSGHALGVFSLSLFALIYYLVRVVELKGVRRVGRGVLALGASVGIAAVVCSVLILPLAEFMTDGLSPRQFPETHRNLYVRVKSLKQFGLMSLVSLFLPHLHSAWDVGVMPDARSNTYAYLAYCGILVPVLAAYAVARGAARRAHLAMVVLGSAFLFCLAPLSLLAQLPILKEITPWYAAPGFSLGLVVLGGMGLERLASVRGRGDRITAFIVLITLVVTFNGVVMFRAEPNFLKAPQAEVRVMLISALIIAGFWLAHVLCARARSADKLLCVVAAALAFLDLYLNGHWIHTPQRRENLFPVSPAVAFLKSQPGLFRVTSIVDDHYGEYILAENAGMAYGIYQLPLCDNLAVNRYVSFMSLLGSPPHRAWHVPVRDSPLLDVANVRYVMTAYAKPLPEGERYQERFADGLVRIYENKEALPRAFVVHDIQFVSSAEEAAAVIKRAPRFLRRRAVVEGGRIGFRTSGLSAPAVSSGSSRGQESVEVREYSAQRVAIDASLARPGLLVLSDTYYPGWKVYVNGQRRAILPTNIMMRGVALPAGDYEVVFVYAPLYYRIGLAVSLLTLAACVVFIGVKVRRGRGRARAVGDSLGG